MLKRIILPYGYGQTCNQLFQISHWIPVANKLGLPLFFPGFKKYSHLFAGTADQRFPSFPAVENNIGFIQKLLAIIACSSAKILSSRGIKLFFKFVDIFPENVTCSGDATDRSINPVEVVQGIKPTVETLWVYGWLYRDYAGIAVEKQNIKNFFSPAPSIRQRVDACIAQARQGSETLVGVHLRRGDYSHWSGGKYYYNDSVVFGLMKRMLNIFPNRKVRFLLVSNEPINYANYEEFNIVRGPDDPVGALFSLASCDYIMGPPSTFTGWASFYGDVPLYEIRDAANDFQLHDFVVCKG